MSKVYLWETLSCGSFTWPVPGGESLAAGHIPQFSPCGLLGLELASFCLLIRLEP